MSDKWWLMSDGELEQWLGHPLPKKKKESGSKWFWWVLALFLLWSLLTGPGEVWHASPCAPHDYECMDTYMDGHIPGPPTFQ